MLAYDLKAANHCAGDQAILSLVLAVSEQARKFYQRTAPFIDDNNIRRYFIELELLHQQAESFAAAENTKVATDQDVNAICQWYRDYSTEPEQEEQTWLAELPQQLRWQLGAFKRLNRGLTQPDNAKAVANLTAGLQIVTDQLCPLLLRIK
ncbi:MULTISPECIES: hypothetical protein [unclassified Arsukibacterium]|uniref:hypothetical protein n=1 Tax=unclassified Arsukibacterium TaxID=2635278 RepID=UPI000C4C8E51|nr:MULTISPECIES: hypothetical protein [unclassified Arsukibacterium]MAA93833.1 hypothetical protein [Rheinheimera sp.]MBM34387.1 hypothetical protein [Rheinheimera sp.]HAW92088.1 hypothetical protein [Candidatus Azambacteria bacterium]